MNQFKWKQLELKLTEDNYTDQKEECELII